MRNFRWMPGMLTTDGRRCVDAHMPQLGATFTQGSFVTWEDSEDLRDVSPDLTDPATLGCMLALVREAWNDPGISIQGRYTDGRWFWLVNGGHYHGAAFRRLAGTAYNSEAEAMVAALEAAP